MPQPVLLRFVCILKDHDEDLFFWTSQVFTKAKPNRRPVHHHKCTQRAYSDTHSLLSHTHLATTKNNYFVNNVLLVMMEAVVASSFWLLPWNTLFSCVRVVEYASLMMAIVFLYDGRLVSLWWFNEFLSSSLGLKTDYHTHIQIYIGSCFHYIISNVMNQSLLE